jgi:hypothetical protein
VTGIRNAALAAIIATTLTVWAQPMPPLPGAPEYPQGDPRSPQGNRGLQPAQGPNNGTPDDGQGDAPDRGVARISYMNGSVSVRLGDSGDLVAGIVNAPLTIGDRVVTGAGSRAEVQFDSANFLRLGPSSEVRLSELRYHRDQIQVAAGTVSFRVLRDSDTQVEISTPSLSLHPARRGVYRVNIRPDGTTEITLRGGAEGEVFGPRGSEPIHDNSTMLVRGSSDDPEFQVVQPGPEDDLDHWAASRDQQLERAVSPRNVPRDVYGAEDLDNNGRWVNDPQYGQVWQPTGVDPGWAPYQCGRWVWMDYYGWTWVGCESWGWAPYHYGRWFYGSYGWAWWPGAMYSPYYWRPALVGFFGWGGGGIGVGFGFGNVGWVPLAPYERFHPWYGAGFYGGYRGATIVNNINVTNVYRNARYAGGVTSMRAGEFGRGTVNSASMVRASTADLRSAGAVRGQLPFQPSRQSTQFTNRAATMTGAPRTSDNARFFSRTPAASVNRVPFEQQRQAFATRSAAPAGSPSGISTLRGGAAGSTSPAGNSGGWQRMSPGGSSGQAPRAASPAGNSGGWQRFPSAAQASPAPQSRGAYNAAPSRGPSAPQQLRISPRIIQNRGGGSGPGYRGGGGGGGSRGGGGGGSHGGGGRR